MLKPLIDNITGGVGKNLSKAGDKLTTGALDRLNAEQKAISDGKIEIANEITRQIVDQIVVPEEYAKRAVAKYGEKIVREQTIIDKIFGRSKKIIQDTPPDKYEDNSNVEDINDDWLNQFREVACKKDSEEAQELFSKVLAGEIRKPGSFSLKALTTLADIDQHVAMVFKAFCSLCLVALDNTKLYHLTQSKSYFKIKDARIPIIRNNLYDGTTEILKDSELIYTMFGLRIEEFILLIEHNLILDNTKFALDNFWYNDEWWQLTTSEASMPPSSEECKSVALPGYALTHVGKELYRIVEFKTRPTYWERISEFLKDYYDINLYKIPKPRKKPSSNTSTSQNTSNKSE